MFAALAPLALLAGTQVSGPDASWFPFVIPWDGIVSGSAPDVRFLNEAPAGKNGFIVVKNGKFTETSTGKTVRFLGVNITGRQAFPTRPEAEKVARRLAQLGVNIVRFHHLQQTWDPDGMIWKKSKPNVEIDPAQVDRLDYFIAQLKKNGIYINMNLQTTRTYQPEQGFPESVKDIPFSFCKRIDKVNPRMIELQKQYALDLLDRVNPYTKVAYKDEPSLAMVEINNENSLVGDPWDGGLGKGPEALPEPFKSELLALWNDWLASKYRDDAELAEAWTQGITETGPLMTTKTSQWTWENQSNGDVQFSVEAPIGAGAPTLKALVNSNPGPDWHVQAHIAGLDFKPGQYYTVKFKVRSDRHRSIGIDARLDQPDWRNLGLSATLLVSDQETEQAFSFKAKDTLPGHGRISFVLGATTGTVWIRDVQVFSGVKGAGPKPVESLLKKNVGIPQTALERQTSDWIQFLAETEKNYTDGMHAFLRKSLGLRANIIDTQISWGGITGPYREQVCEYADNHAYWEHPSFPGQAWDASNWFIPNTPMVDDMAKQGGTLLYMASSRMWGKPYTVSEYNHPAPNDYQAEMMPIVMSFAAIQDWDGIFGFDYGTTQEGQPNDSIQGFFALGTNPAKMAFFPSTAVLYRLGLIAPASGTEVLRLPPKGDFRVASSAELWRQRGPLPDWRASRIGLSFQSAVSSPGKATRAVRLKTNGNHTDYLIDAPAAKGVVGFVGGRRILLDGLTLSFRPFSNGFAALTLVSMDKKPLAASSRALLTVASRVENKEMGWNDKRTSVGNQWGKGPVQVQPVAGKVTLKTGSLRRVFALRADGSRLAPVPAKFVNGTLSFAFNDKTKSMWFELVK